MLYSPRFITTALQYYSQEGIIKFPSTRFTTRAKTPHSSIPPSSPFLAPASPHLNSTQGHASILPLTICLPKPARQREKSRRNQGLNSRFGVFGSALRGADTSAEKNYSDKQAPARPDPESSGRYQRPTHQTPCQRTIKVRNQTRDQCGQCKTKAMTTHRETVMVVTKRRWIASRRR
jgi:hypothetical protein